MNYGKPYRVMHRVYMGFEKQEDGWLVEFLASGLSTRLPRTLHFKDCAKIRELADRGNADMTLATIQGIAYGIRAGKGGVYLSLTDEQFKKLSQLTWMSAAMHIVSHHRVIATVTWGHLDSRNAPYDQSGPSNASHRHGGS